MPATVAKRPKNAASVEIVRGFLDSAIYYGLLDAWLTGFIGELEAGSDPVDAACTSAEEWDFGGFIGSLGSNDNDDRLQTAVLNSRGQLTIPSEVRDELKLAVGDRVEFVRTIDGHYVLLPSLRQ
jgi:AbrB family looped-hinge helix DNA binding protein